MADRVLNDAGDVYADLAFSGTITADLVNPIGTTILTGQATTDRGENRRSFSVNANVLNQEGVWVVTWTNGTSTKRQEFTVGHRKTGLTKYALRMVVANTENDVIDHTMTVYDAGQITDRALVATTAAYRNRWVVLHPDAGVALAGRTRRITDFSGSAISLSHPFPSAPSAGTRYAILRLDPAEIDRAFEVAAAEMVSRGRVPLTISGLVSVAGSRDDTVEITVPDCFTHVDTVWITNHAADTEWNGLEIAAVNWRMKPSRKIVIDISDMDAGDTFQIAGERNLLPMQFEDSVLDVAPKALIHLCAQELMAPRAGGAGTDVKEHLRRLLISQQGWDQSLRHSAGRPKAGRREVLR